jgi:hypothetical protein
VGTALLILAEILVWGIVLVGIGALIETAWARLRRGAGRKTLKD